MDESIQTKLADSAQLNCTVDNPPTCVKSGKKRATPRKIPGLSTTDERGFLKSDRELLGGLKKPGSLYASLMLGQLRHDFERDKHGNPGHAQRVHDGHFWVAYSLTYWERQLGLTENEARSGVQCLADSNGVVVVGKFKFGNEPKYLHFRLTEKALGYVPATPLEGGCVATTQGVCANHTATTPTVLAPTVKPNLNTQYAAEENQQPSASAHTPESPSKVSGKKIPGQKLKASKPFLDVFLNRKREWLKVAATEHNPGGCLLPELTATDRDVCQRFEHQLTKGGIDPLAFLDWLTPFRFQQFAFGLDDEADFSAHWLGTKARQLLLIERYRQDLDVAEQAKKQDLTWAEAHPEEYAEFVAHHAAKAPQSLATPSAAPDVGQPMPEPAQAPVASAASPVVVQSACWDDDDERPLTEAEKEAALAKWLAPAMQQHQAETDAKKVADSKKRITAAVTMPQAKKATMFQKKAA